MPESPAPPPRWQQRIAGILASRVGRRLVAQFLGCAMLPLALLYWLTFTQMDAHQQAETEASLHVAAKTAGMAVAQHLSGMVDDLDIASRLLLRDGHGALQQADAVTAARLEHCFLAIQRCGVQGPQLELGTATGPSPHLTSDEQEFVDQGHSLVVEVTGDEPQRPCELAIVRRLAAPAADLLIAWVRRGALWSVEELQTTGAEVFVVGRDCKVLFRSTEAEVDLQPALALWRRPSASGTFEWRIGGAPHVASYWHLFLKPQYGADWLVVQSRDRAREFAPLLGFQRRFMLIAVLATLVVLAASMYQIRRTLDPIERLQAATKQIARGDFSVRADIGRRDEFGDLGRSFDAMTGELLENIRRREQTEQALVLARDKALEAARVRTDFLTNVSHELRTPLTAIVSGIEILHRYDDDDAEIRAEFVSMIGGEAARLTALVDDILQLASPAQWELEPTDVGAALRSAVESMSADNRARIALTVGADLPRIAGDREHLIDVFEHLLDNAAKFSPPGSPIEVTAVAADGQCVVEVTDHGRGIAAADLPHLFEPFRQFGNDILTEKPSGTGLGLALARNIVDRHRGRIAVTSTPGQGSTFRVELPALAEIGLTA